MAKQDPFTKEDGQSKEDFIDFSDPAGGFPKRGGNRNRIILATLVLAGLAGGAVYYFTQEEEEISNVAMEEPKVPKAPKEHQMPKPPPPPVEMNAANNPATPQKMETPSNVNAMQNHPPKEEIPAKTLPPMEENTERPVKRHHHYKAEMDNESMGEGAASSHTRMKQMNAAKRDIAILEPKNGATLVKDTGMVSWRGDHYVTYYRVEITNKGWANPSYRFATTGTQMQVHNVPQGAYDMRIGAFSELSGRWEYTNPIKVTVQ